MDYENQIVLGECLPTLKGLPSNTFDSAVFDPPYGLGKEPSPEQILAYLKGADLKTGDFAGRKWDIPSIPTWHEIFRVVKPGAHVLFFGGSRTWDLLSMGARFAGFQFRDTIADHSSGLVWIQSQGMPKSKTLPGHPGLGTGLKPVWEPILVCRKPLIGTLAENVSEYGTGGINIDAARVRHASRKDFEEHRQQVEEIKRRGGVRRNSWKNSSDLSGANDVKEEGRWPPNCLFEHAPGCEQTGMTEVAPHAQGAARFQKTSGGTFSSAYGNQMASDQPETLIVWKCVEGCPVRTLEEQRPTEEKTGSLSYGDAPVSRFYHQFESPLRYVPKASDREATLDGQVENLHPTRKPVKLIRWLVKLSTPKHGLTLDPYCGSGTTLVAALEEDVRFFGIERDKDSYMTACGRVRLTRERLEATKAQEVDFLSLIG
jgi:site-specific DNA-methyltransferase (adenine-specific)